MFIIFCFFVLLIIWTMVGYPIFILFLGKLTNKKIDRDYQYKPSVTLLIAAHNEEKVIRDKLENCLKIDYPKEKFNIIVASDYSTDNTNLIVKEYENKYSNIKLYVAKQHMGKTNAQNEAVKIIDSEVIVMTDANPMLDKNAISELVATLAVENVSYVCGMTKYINSYSDNQTAQSEGFYWNLEMKVRENEAKIQTITAGDGSLYACRKSDYIDFPPICCHDSAMPLYFALKGKRAVCNYDAVAYEKAGETDTDEFKRKVRMNRQLIKYILPDISILNIFKYKWFTIFYIGHRTFRYLLWFFHAALLIINTIIATKNVVFLAILIIQLIFITTSILESIGKWQSKNRLIHLISYYGMTVVAQYVGIYRIITGKAKPTWEIAKSTR